jgi:hypothetical protein
MAEPRFSGASIKPDEMYRVFVKRAVRLGKFGATVLTPRAENLVRGEVLSTIKAEDIERAEKV